MKPNIHPVQHQVLAQCVCNNEFYFYSSLESKVMHVEVCNKCHPFFTGKQQVVTTAGRVDSFNNKFNNFRDKNIKAIQAKAETSVAKSKKVRKETSATATSKAKLNEVNKKK